MTQAGRFATARMGNQSSREKSFSAGPELHSLFEELLLDDGFDQIGRLDHDGPEFDTYRERNALPLE